MSTVERPRNKIVRPWQTFADGTPYPTFCWAPPFMRAFTQKVKPGFSPDTGLLVVAAGEHDNEIAHAVFGEISPARIVKSLHRATNGINRLGAVEQEAFGEAYKRIINEPSRSNVNVLVMTVDKKGPDNDFMAHLGSREIDEIIPHLGVLATKLMASKSRLIL